MKEYVLFTYVPSMDIWCEIKTSITLKSLKNYVKAEREENFLLNELYIRSKTRVVKRYKDITNERYNLLG